MRMLLIGAVAITTAGSLNAATIDTSSIEWTYTISGGKVILGGGNASHPAIPTSTAGDLTIPETIDGREVVEIGEYAFAGCSGLTSIVVPNCITRIGKAAFSGCNSLANITLPFVGSERGNTGTPESMFGHLFGESSGTGLVKTEQYYTSSDLITRYIPASLTHVTITDEILIGYRAFWNCSMLMSIGIPETVTYVGTQAFKYCDSLEEVHVKSLEAWCGIEWATEASNPLCYARKFYLNNELITCLKIPDSVEEIKDKAFYTDIECAGGGSLIEKVVFHDGLKRIGTRAFGGFAALKDIEVPKSVTNIGYQAFGCCSSLTNMVLPFVGSERGNAGSRESLFGYIFGSAKYNGGVETVSWSQWESGVGIAATNYIPATLKSVVVADETRIGYGAFERCNTIETLMLNDGITGIGKSSFFLCSSLKTVKLPASIDAIESGTLSGCASLSKLELPEPILKLGNGAIKNCSALTSIELPSRLAEIGESCFADCTSLKEIVVPNSVTNIASGAFGGCSSLTNMVLPFIGAARRSVQPTYTTEASFGYIFGTASYKGGVATEQTDGAPNGAAETYTYYIPQSLKSVTITDETLETGTHAFHNCSNLVCVTLSEGMYRIRGSTFDCCSKLAYVNIPQSVTRLIGTSFYGCAISRIEIPSAVDFFDNNVFKNCSKLKTVIFHGNAPSQIGSNNFSGTASGCTAYVMPGSTGWNVTIPGKWQGINIDYLKSVEYDANGGVVAADVQWFANGDAIGELPVPTRAGYAFDGWFTQADGGSKVAATTTVSANRTFYAHWTANNYSITYDANGGVGTMDATDCTYDQEGTIASSAFARSGYEFVGWATEAGGEAVYSAGQTVSNLSEESGGTVTLYAVWKLLPPVFTPESGTTFGTSALTISLASEAEGATIYYTTDGSNPTVESTVYRRFRITDKTTVKAIAVKDGESSEVAVAEYAPGRCVDPVFSLADGAEFAHSNQVVSIQWNNDGVLRYTLDGSEPTAESPVYEVPFAFNDSVVVKAKVFGDDYFDSAVVSVALTRVWENAATPAIEAAESFTGSKTKVVITCATENAAIYYTLDGSEPTQESLRYVSPIYVTESCTVKARAILVDYLDSAVAAQEIVKTWVIGDTMGKPDHEFTTDETGGLGWARVEDPSAPNGEAMRSGEIANGQTSTLSTVLVGPGTLTFAWRTSCEDSGGFYDWDHAELVVDGRVMRQLDGISDRWLSESVSIAGDGMHSVEWRYVKDNAESAGEDAAWVAGYNWVSDWTATRTTDVPVPYVWLAANNKDIVDEYESYEAAAKLTGANGHKVWESYVIGADPNDKNDSLCITAFPMKADGTPDLENLALSPEQSKWNVEGAKPVIKGRAMLEGSDEWQTVTDENKADMRFFRVEVALP